MCNIKSYYIQLDSLLDETLPACIMPQSGCHSRISIGVDDSVD